ncbi:MAG: hypothetical protein K9G26_09025 [Emcibacter sp.]|nr:hypothetical protein [Emcibacter sp.]
MKYVLIFLMPFSLMACDISLLDSKTKRTCKEIALSRLKHPESYENMSTTEKTTPPNQTMTRITFDAWNDYKVQIPHNVSCLFQTTENKKNPNLISFTWNGRNIRQHELDDIKNLLDKQ